MGYERKHRHISISVQDVSISSDFEESPHRNPLQQRDAISGKCYAEMWGKRAFSGAMADLAFASKFYFFWKIGYSRKSEAPISEQSSN